MTEKLQWQLLQRRIKANLGRFIAIVLIIMLGVLLFVGIRSSGPDLYHNAQVYFNNQKASDVQVISPTKLTSAEIKQAQKLAETQVEATQFVYALTAKNQQVVQFMSLPKRLNRPKIIVGRLPKTDKEVVLDAQLQKTYQLGATYKLESVNGLKQTSYQIVGFVTSPLFTDNTTRGSTNIGDGTINHFAYTLPTNFTVPSYQLLSARSLKLAKLNPYQSEYQHQVKQLNKDLKQRLNQQVGTAKNQYRYQTRADWSGYSGYGDLTERIAAIANIFPVIFFLIAVLITFTTMTRMIEEDRIQIGTFKALGYTKAEIARSYWSYALVAAAFGVVAGIVIGSQTLPRIVTYMMNQQYSLPMAGIQYDLSTLIIATGMGLFATLGAVLFAINRVLHERPADLMLPKTPKAGKKILLERIRPLWRRMSFNQKVSYRNLFRFKSRMWMTIIGIAGGTGLILCGFGIRDSIDYSGQGQFAQIMHYQAVITLQPGDRGQAAAKLADNKQYQGKLPVYTEMVQLTHGTTKVTDVTAYATRQSNKLGKYIHLSTALPNDGALLSQKAAKLLNAKVGTKLTLKDADNVTHKIRVAGITKNYAGHFIYFSKDYLNKALNQVDVPTTWLVKLKSQTKHQEEQLAKQLLQTNQVVNTTFMSTQREAVDRQTQMLQIIVIIFILLSGLLTFIVLYNLTNINVSERIRELSTIKVLGFYNHEVTFYIVRENFILTVVGIIAGLGVGNLMTGFILHQAETDQVVFPLEISLVGYLTAIAMTLIFTFIVMIVTHVHLQKVDMIAALKANE